VLTFCFQQKLFIYLAPLQFTIIQFTPLDNCAQFKSNDQINRQLWHWKQAYIKYHTLENAIIYLLLQILFHFSVQTPLSRHPQNEQHIFNSIKWSKSFLLSSSHQAIFSSFSSRSTLNLLKLRYLCHCRWKIPWSDRHWSSNLSLPSTTTKTSFFFQFFH